MKLILLILVLFVNNHAQQIKELNSKYFFEVNNEIILTEDAIEINADNAQKFLVNINGYKNLISSPQNEYSLICNYDFNEQQPEFEISLFLFDKDNFELVNELKILSPSDLPHPLFKVSDAGIIFSYNPLMMEIKKYENDDVKEFELEKDVPFEMERAAFIEITDEAFYVLTSIKPLMIDSNEKNALLYKMNLDNSLIDKTLIDLTIPTLIYADGNEVYVSGVKFNNSVAAGSTFRLNNSSEIVNTNNLSIKKIIPFENGNLAQTDNSIIKMSKELSTLAEYKVDGKRITDFTVNADQISALVNDENSNSVIRFDEDLNLLDQTSINLNDVADYSSINIIDDNLIIHTANKTYVFE